LTRHDRRIARLELETSGVWYAETTSGVGAYRREKGAAIQAALENERQALMMDVMEDRGKRQLQARLTCRRCKEGSPRRGRMNTRPILFRPESVRAIINGRKRVMRQPVRMPRRKE
jgi:hypothetical protein